MILEMLGLPGSGKTTLARMIAGQRPDTTSVKSNRLSKHDLVSHPIASTTGLVREIPDFVRCSDRRLFLELARRRVRQRQLVAWSDHAHTILEESVLHHLWRARLLDPELQATWAHTLLGEEHPVVFLRTSREHLRRRIQEKTFLPPVNALLNDCPDGDPVWDRAEHLYETLLGELATRRDVHEIDSTDADAATARLNSILGSPGAR